MENSQNSRQGNINDQDWADVTALTISMTKKFEQLHPVSEERCIYRVPKLLRVLNEKAYTPRCVSIGPYHHGKDELWAMEEHKTMYLQHFLRFNNVRLERFVSCVRDNETRLRNCYQERIDLSSDIFVSLMLVDVAFVIMVMVKICLKWFPNENDMFFNKPYMIHDIRNDMILLENQLPLFILNEFLSLSNLHESISMVKLCSDFLGYQFPLSMVNPSQELNFYECKHLVDFLRIGQQPLVKKKRKQAKALDAVNLPSVVELHRAGVKFQCASNLRLVDINFCEGILEIPLLQLNDSTEILFRNLQAFELCQIDGDEGYFNDYIAMISMLVTNGKDVEILTKEGIIENWLHDNEQVVHLLHNPGKENLINNGKFYFIDVVNDLNKYCRKRRNRWRASLVQNYFYSPWAIISVIAAVYIILLTTIQTICSILQVKQQQ